MGTHIHVVSKEHADFMAVKTDLSESIDAVERAIKAIYYIIIHYTIL